MTKRGEERGEQTRVINFHIVWIMENVSLSWKNYTDLSPARNALWIVRGNIVLMNATTRHISSPKTTRPQGSEDSCKTRWKYIFLLKKYAPASSGGPLFQFSFPHFPFYPFFLGTMNPIYRHRGITKGGTFSIFSFFFSFSQERFVEETRKGTLQSN